MTYITESSSSQAVAYCHVNGFVHRDIKLENVMVNAQDPHNHNVILIDFGLSLYIQPQPVASSPTSSSSTSTSTSMTTTRTITTTLMPNLNINNQHNTEKQCDNLEDENCSRATIRPKRRRKQSIIEDFSGSPLYMPPEVLNRLPHDPFNADVWGLGTIQNYISSSHFGSFILLYRSHSFVSISLLTDYNQFTSLKFFQNYSFK
jgi:serine/threonine protein kinase